MSNAQFKADFAKLLQRAGAKAELVVRKTALDLQASMVEMSPVDTGRFKGNWQGGITAVNFDASAVNDKTGTGAIGRTYAALQGWGAGQTIYLTNSLPYSRALEHGHSQQAPVGMVKVTVTNYAQALRKVVAEMK